MSWREGLDLYFDFLRLIDKCDIDERMAIDFKARLLDVFIDFDVDPCCIEEDEQLSPILKHLEDMQSDD